MSGYGLSGDEAEWSHEPQHAVKETLQLIGPPVCEWVEPEAVSVNQSVGSSRAGEWKQVWKLHHSLCAEGLRNSSSCC